MKTFAIFHINAEHNELSSTSKSMMFLKDFRQNMHRLIFRIRG